MFIHVFIFISLHAQYVATSLCWAVSGLAGLVFFQEKRGDGGPFGPWTSMVPGFTTPAGFVTAAQAVHVISPLETDRLQVAGFRETRQLHSYSKLPFRKGKPN